MIALIVGLIVTLVVLALDAIKHKLKVKHLFSGFLAVWLVGTVCVGLPIWGAYSVISWVVSPSPAPKPRPKPEDNWEETFRKNADCLADGALVADEFLASGSRDPGMSSNFKNQGCAKYVASGCAVSGLDSCADGYSLEIRHVLNGEKSYVQKLHESEMEGR